MRDVMVSTCSAFIAIFAETEASADAEALDGELDSRTGLREREPGRRVVPDAGTSVPPLGGTGRGALAEAAGWPGTGTVD